MPGISWPAHGRSAAADARAPETPAREAALALGVQRLEDVAMERALYGVEALVYHFGEVVGHRRVYNDRLLMFMLRNRAPKRFAADSHHNADAATKGQLDRLKAQWRKEWEVELAEKQRRDSKRILESINAKLDLMKERKEQAEALALEWDGEGGG